MALLLAFWVKGLARETMKVHQRSALSGHETVRLLTLFVVGEFTIAVYGIFMGWTTSKTQQALFSQEYNRCGCMTLPIGGIAMKHNMERASKG